jgi:hypothetical protein
MCSTSETSSGSDRQRPLRPLAGDRLIVIRLRTPVEHRSKNLTTGVVVMLPASEPLRSSPRARYDAYQARNCNGSGSNPQSFKARCSVGCDASTTMRRWASMSTLMLNHGLHMLNFRHRVVHRIGPLSDLTRRRNLRELAHQGEPPKERSVADSLDKFVFANHH